VSIGEGSRARKVKARYDGNIIIIINKWRWSDVCCYIQYSGAILKPKYYDGNLELMLLKFASLSLTCCHLPVSCSFVPGRDGFFVFLQRGFSDYHFHAVSLVSTVNSKRTDQLA
jgi:hypothetical protein